MQLEIKIPSPGESITEVELANWLVEDGDYVKKDQEIAEIESDKATLPLIAEDSGTISILVSEGETVKVDTVACRIDTEAKAPATSASSEKKEENRQSPKAGKSDNEKAKTGKPDKEVRKPAADDRREDLKAAAPEGVKATPLARKLMEENGLSVDDILNGLKKITTREVKLVADDQGTVLSAMHTPVSRELKREPMSQLRKKLARRLVGVKNETAMLTTFNEVDMSAVIDLRKKYQPVFLEAHGVKLGFMSFFIKAATLALKEFPRVNSMMGDDEILTPEYVDISIAVQTAKGLMVPVIRNTESLSLAEIERSILDLAGKARKFRLSIEEMSGGTFSITNGGVFGSMLSTPILNPPQSAILGMHNIVERPVAIQGKVEIRPVMYVALSYDHRIVDGRESVSFLVKIKELLEDPRNFLFGGKDPERLLLDI